MISIIRLLSQKKIKNKMLTDDVVLLVLLLISPVPVGLVTNSE
jgi:hypothetical protein